MAFSISPGVTTSEIDLTTTVPAISTTNGGFAGRFQWGPADEVTTVDSEVKLVSTFGEPDGNTYPSFFTAANFLSYGNNLQIVRSVGANAKNATANAGGLLVKNKSIYEAAYSSQQAVGTYGPFAARYAGDLGNGIQVAVCPNANVFTGWAYSSYFNGAPGTSDYASSVNGVNDEMHVIVLDSTGKITGTANTVLETYPFVSKASDARNNDGSTNFVRDVILNKSKYIYWLGNLPGGNNWATGAAGKTFTDVNTAWSATLANGVTDLPTDGNLQNSYSAFLNADKVDISLLLSGDASTTVATYLIQGIAESRKDCVAFVSPALTDVVNTPGNEVTNITATRNSLPSSSYAFLDSNWKYQLDKYNNVYRFVPMNGDIAGLCVTTDSQRDPWFSPAGFNRGQIKNAIKVAWNPDQTDRDDLYKIGVNPVVAFQGQGTVLYGDKTLLSKPSAFDRINVRRLFIVLEKKIAVAAKYSLFEFNDEFTRAAFVSLVEPFLRQVKGRRGIYDYRVVCDDTNNTPEIIDANQFVGDIYIKPARSINFIQLNFVAVATGVNFSEIQGQF